MAIILNGGTGIVSPNYTGNGTVPVGSVYHFAASTTPTGFLICNGDTVPNGAGTVQGVTTDFSALYAIVGTTYGAAGALPDLRGYFIRGNGTNGDGTASASFGVKQADEIKSHFHTIPKDTGITYTTGSNTAFSANTPASATISSGNTGGTETRPANIALLPCIKY